jgi:hypothetical protein
MLKEFYRYKSFGFDKLTNMNTPFINNNVEFKLNDDLI